MRFRDREDAGRHLAAVVAPAVEGADPVVVGLPRGGVPVAYEVARASGPPRRHRGPQARCALPARAGHGRDRRGRRPGRERGRARSAGLGTLDVDAVERRERAELDRRGGAVPGRPRPARRLGALRHRGRRRHRHRFVGPRRVSVSPARPGRGASSCSRRPSRRACARVAAATPATNVCVAAPDPFYAVGEWYDDFSQTTDDEVVALLRPGASTGLHGPRAMRRTAARRGGGTRPAPAAPLVGPGRRRGGHHCARIGFRAVRGGRGARRRLDAARPRRVGRLHRRQGGPVGDEPRRRPRGHPSGLAREPARHRHRGPPGPAAGHPRRDGRRSRG